MIALFLKQLKNFAEITANKNLNKMRMVANPVKVQLLVQPADLEFMLQMLQVFKRKQMLDFSVEKSFLKGNSKEEAISLDGPSLTGEELRRIVEEAEKEPMVEYKDFKAAFGL